MRIRIQPHEFKLLADYVYHLTGIYLDEGKGYLLEYRLSPLLEEYKLNDYESFYQRARREGGAVREALISAITTDETSFFRDKHPYTLLTEKLLPDLIAIKKERGSREIRVWSAATSRGQEPYSIAMICREFLEPGRFHLSILATDISERALNYARKGEYSKFELSRGLTLERLERHFVKVADTYRVRDELRDMVTFRKLNLHEPFLGIQPFDIIFCRNVAVYFTEGDRIKLFTKLSRYLHPWGRMVLGSTESLVGLLDCFKARLYNGCYYYDLNP